MPGFCRSRRVCCSEKYSLQRRALAGNQRFYRTIDFHNTDGRHQTSTRSLLPVRLISVVAKTPDVIARQPKLYAAA